MANQISIGGNFVHSLPDSVNEYDEEDTIGKSAEIGPEDLKSLNITLIQCP